MRLPEEDPDQSPLDRALAEAGLDARWLAWDDPSADWTAPVPTILRSTWNYPEHRVAFLDWCERVGRVAPLWNPPDLVRINTHKSYLLELEQRGVPIAPTALIERAAAAHTQVAQLGWKRVVIKPAVGAGSVGTRAFHGADPAADEHVARLAETADVLVQPYVESVDGHGEHALVWIDGSLTHQVHKAPRFAGQRERVSAASAIEDDARALALRTLEPWADRLLYARVDIARDAQGRPLVMEVELTEPSLFFDFCPGSAQRYVAGIVRRLAG